MRFWPFKREKRESAYTDAVIARILTDATGGSLAAPTATGALETAAGVIARAFASAEVQGPEWAQAALTPVCLSMIGRSLIRHGEILFAIDTTDGALRLWPVSDFDMDGTHNPATWTYRLTMAGPSALTTRDPVSAAGVLHCRYASDPDQPWRGIGPIQSAALAGRLSAEVVKHLADEASGPRGHLLPFPSKDGEDDTLTGLKRDLRRLHGDTAVVESTTTIQPDRSSAADWQSRRLGFDAPASLVELADRATREVLSTCGISPALFDSRAAAASREAYRQLLHGVVAPLGRIVAAELTDKLETEVAFDWAELRAGDIAGRARAFQSLVGAGMDVAKAAALSGLMVQEAD